MVIIPTYGNNGKHPPYHSTSNRHKPRATASLCSYLAHSPSLLPTRTIPSTLTPVALNVNASIIRVTSTSFTLPSDNWNLISTPNGGVLRAGDGVSISNNVSTNGSILFAPKSAVQITYSAHWNLGSNDRFTMGYFDVGGHQEFFYVR
jgi:hypothetical protein